MLVQRLVAYCTRVGRETVAVYWDLLKIMVPVMILVRLAVEFGLIGLLAEGFAPVMGLAGLPPEMGLVWATACLVNLYGGAVALIGVLPEAPLTVAQMTVLGSMMLIAHNFPIEVRVTQKAGANLLAMLALRLGIGLAYGVLLNAVYAGTGTLAEPASIAWLPDTPPHPGWIAWTKNQAATLAGVFVIVLALIALLRAFDILGVTEWLTRALTPVLRLMGIGPAAAPLAMIGVLLGIAYGGALIVREVRAGHLGPKDVFLSLAFMSLCHGLIEDTIFIATLDAHLSGILIGRVLITLAVIALLARLIEAMPERAFRRVFYPGPKAPALNRPTP